MALHRLLYAEHSTPVPAQGGPKERLEKSRRHHEWVAVKNGDRTVHSFLVFPEVKEKALAVVVIHENRGLTDWVRSVADRLAEAGYIAVAPDLLSGTGPNKGKTSDFASEDDARKAIYELKPDQVMSDLGAVADHVAKLPAASGKVAVAGFCWGGAQSFAFAGRRKDLAAAFVFYGTGPDSKEAAGSTGRATRSRRTSGRRGCTSCRRRRRWRSGRGRRHRHPLVLEDAASVSSSVGIPPDPRGAEGRNVLPASLSPGRRGGERACAVGFPGTFPRVAAGTQGLPGGT